MHPLSGLRISDKLWNRIVGEIYEAALEPQRWRNVLKTIGEPVRAHIGQIVSVASNGRNTFDSIFEGVDDAKAFAEFDELVGRGGHLRATYAAEVPEMAPLYDSLHTSKQARRKSLFYQEHANPHKVPYYCGTVLRKDQEMFVASAVFRREQEGHFSREEVEYVQSLAPHMRRSIELATRVPEAGFFECAQSIIDAMQCAAVVVDTKQRVAATNDRARRILRDNDGIGVTSNAVRFWDSLASRRLHLEYQAMLCEDYGRDAMINGRFVAQRPSGRTPYRVFVLPLQQRVAPFGGRSCAVVIVDPEEAVEISTDTIQRDCGLTPSESGVVALLVSGKSLAEIARARRCKLETVRSQLKSAMRKTGTSRQVELVSLILRGNSITIRPTLNPQLP